MTVFQGSNQLNIKRIRKADEGEYQESDYLPVSSKDIKIMYQELTALVRSFQNPYLKKLASSYFLEDKAFVKKFCFHSAAKSVHHGFVGGLLEHTLSVMTVSYTHLDVYKRQAHFRPEFLNRLDEIILFKPLTKGNIGGIIELLIADVNKRLADKELKIALTDEAKDFIIENGYDPVYGARPLKRYLQKNVETLAAKLILADGVRAGDTIEIGLSDGKLTASAVHSA